MTYAYKRAITIDHTKVPNTDQANFPVLVSWSDASMKTVANGGHITNSSGYDLIFGDANQNKYDHEIEKYDGVNGVIVMWVRVPTVSHSSDTILYMYYNDSSIVTSQENPHGVWDANYKGVWHLGNGTILSVLDSTSNINNGTNNGVAATTGQIDGGASFDGSSNYISLPTNNFPSGNNPSSLQCWYKNPTSLIGSGYPVLVEFGHRYSRESGFYFNQSDAHLHLSNSTTDLDGGKPSDNVFHHVVGTFDGSILFLYIDGVLITSHASTQNILLDQAYIGADFPDNLYFPGIIDEVRISDTARSADWIATEYNNQSNPSAFYSIGSEQNLLIHIPEISVTWKTRDMQTIWRTRQ